MFAAGNSPFRGYVVFALLLLKILTLINCTFRFLFVSCYSKLKAMQNKNIILTEINNALTYVEDLQRSAWEGHDQGAYDSLTEMLTILAHLYATCKGSQSTICGD